MPLARLLTGALLATSLTAAQAASLTLFDNRDDFLTATGASAASGPLPNLGATGSATTLGSITFNEVPGHGLFIGVAGVGITEWTPLISPNAVAISDTEDLDLATAAPVHALGFEFVEPSVGGSGPGTCFVATCIDSSFNVTLVNGTTVVGEFQFAAPDDVLAFVGVWSTLAFDRVRIRESVGGNDDEFFGQVFTGTAAPVPVPAALPLLAGALTLLGARRRRRA